ncbi:response regulator transcription factor [Sulfurovum sp.]|uniref:response regulator transcription factor n=1 Tax=Sulfurovum sp. TaxID=1969726 RepID=UPI0028683980|nr:response regulator transcription factor [Sulfurovum sp.]
MEDKKTYNIIVADDHEIVRTGIKFTVEAQDNFFIEDEASSFNELKDLLAKKSYDFLILDLNLGDRNGIPSIREISDSYSKLPILVLSMFPEEPYALQSIQAGASGYLNKTMVSEELICAINTIIDGNTYLNEAYLDTLPYGTPFAKTAKSSIESLSKREFEVYSLIAEGMKSKEIAEQLGLSQKTISTYLTRILEKLSLSNTTQLIHFALQNSLGKS